MLFRNWRAIFVCNQELANNTYIKFGKDSALNGHTKDVVKQIHDVCQFLQECLDQWNKHVDDHRTASYFLNFFSAAQLVHLQTELAKLSSGDLETGIDERIYLLLWNVKPYACLQDLKTCLKLSLKRVEKDFVRKSQVDPSDIFKSAEIENEVLLKKRKCFVEEMKEAGMEIKVIEHAVTCCDLDDIQAGILWCMENENINDEEKMEKEKSLDEREICNNLTFEENTSELMKSLCSEDSLCSRLKELWTKFLEGTSKSVTDYLSLLHVGYFLQELSNLSTSVNIIRPYSKMFRVNFPSVIVCPRVEVYRMLLSIYMVDTGVDLPLPGSDEVLLCTPTTRADDIELFCRRVNSDACSTTSSKIYCLAFADVLDYEDARRTEELLEKYCYNVEHLQLVVICSRENEIQSHLVSALGRHRIEIPMEDLNTIQDYLKNHFIVNECPDLEDDWIPASHLDPERSSIRVIKSYRAGVGKTLKVYRLKEEIENQPQCIENPLVTISLHSKVVDSRSVLKALLEHTPDPSNIAPRIFHIDIAHGIEEGVDSLLFNILILRCIGDGNGYTWTRMPHDLYVVECMPLVQMDAAMTGNKPRQFVQVHQIFELLPTITCWSPMDSLDILMKNNQAMRRKYPNWAEGQYDQTMDETEFISCTIQLPFQTLRLFEAGKNLLKVNPNRPKGTPVECLQCLLKHCGIFDPSWSELFNFVSFLSVQLEDARQSNFCSIIFQDDLPGFHEFVIRFMIRMSKDFATRSLNISEETPGFLLQSYNHRLGTDYMAGTDLDVPRVDLVHQFGLKRRWETSPHPYLFFNSDHQSFTFLGFIIDRFTQNVLDPQTKKIIEEKIMPLTLNQALYRNQVNLNENFDELPRSQKIEKMCSIMGQLNQHDPDSTYELTTDNVKKILAIYMRFRCNIPVIIMGETGCGKTRLVKFMCDMWLPPGVKLENMILMKVRIYRPEYYYFTLIVK